MGEKKKPNYFATQDQTIEVDAFVDISNPQIRVLSDEEESKLDKDKLPENVVRETSTWLVPTWGIHQWVDSRCWVRRLGAPPDAPEQFSFVQYVLARLQALLIKWSLDDSDPTKKLNRAAVGDAVGTVKVLDPQSMAIVASCNPALVNRFYNKAIRVLYPTEETRKN